MKEKLLSAGKSSRLSLASAIFATVSTVCLIIASFYSLSIQYTRGFQTARSIVIAATIAFFASQLVALILGVFGLRRAFSTRGSAADKGDSFFGIVSSVSYVSIAIFFILQVTG